MIGTPEIDATEDSVTFIWRDQGAGIGFAFLYERQDGLHGEVSVTAHVDGMLKPVHIHWARINLSSTTARDNLVKFLVKRTSEDGGRACRYDWAAMVEYACTVAAQRFRDGEPFVDLASVPRPPRMAYLVEKLLPKGQTSVIYSRGASGKSLLAMAVAMAVSRGKALPSGLLVPHAANVLYLDYETDVDEQRLRLDYLWRSLKGEPLPNVIYRRQTRPLAADVQRIRAEVRSRDIGLVIVDSIAYAMGGSAMDAEIVIGAFNALRMLGDQCTRLVVAHIPKAEKDSTQASIFGSVFQENAGRSVWELRSTDETDGIAMGLYLRKKNWGKGFDPVGLRFTFDDARESVELKNLVIEDDPELVSHGSLSYRLLAALRSGSLSTKRLIEETGGDSESIRRTLRRLSSRGEIVQIGANGAGRGADPQWGLAAVNERF